MYTSKEACLKEVLVSLGFNTTADKINEENCNREANKFLMMMKERCNKRNINNSKFRDQIAVMYYMQIRKTLTEKGVI